MRQSIADIECLGCRTKLSLEIPAEIVDQVGIAAMIEKIEASKCPVCDTNSRTLLT